MPEAPPYTTKTVWTYTLITGSILDWSANSGSGPWFAYPNRRKAGLEGPSHTQDCLLTFGAESALPYQRVQLSMR